MAKKVQKVKYIPYEYKLTIDSTKKRTKVVKRMENLVRGCLEQKDLMAFCREYLDFNKCAVFENVTKDPNTKFRVEIHHGPFTLYDICDVVLQKWIDTGLPLDVMLMANEVVELHYRNMVGLIPIAIAVHQSVTKHSDKTVIPLYMYSGEYKKFMKEYAPYISDDLIDKYKRAIDETKGVTKETYDAWNTEFTYLEYDGQTVPEKLEIPETCENRFISNQENINETSEERTERVQNKILDTLIA